MDFNKVETWLTWGLLAVLIYKTVQSPTPPSCPTTTKTGWELSDLLMSNATAEGSALGQFPNMGCSCNE